MADAQTDSALEKTADKTRAATQTAAERARQGVEAEARTFTDGAEAASSVAQRGMDAGADMARRGADAARQFAEKGRQTGQEIADVWRDAASPLLRAQLDAGRWFEQFWRQATGLGVLPTMRPARPLAAFSTAPLFGLPPVDVKETDQAYELSVELPGVAREDVELAVTGDLLTICGSKAERRDDATAAYRLSERRYGRFERSFPIPAGVRRDKIEAAFADGVLHVTLRKTQAAAPASTRVDIR